MGYVSLWSWILFYLKIKINTFCQSSEEDEVDAPEVKKFDAALFDIQKVPPEQFAVSNCQGFLVLLLISKQNDQ